MSINRFFTHVLGAQLKNPRWSWGAGDTSTNRIYLRVWDDQIDQSDGVQWIRIGYDRIERRSNGYAERNTHIEMMRAGVDGYGVVCTAKMRVRDEARSILSFNDQALARLGELRTDGGNTFARVDAYVPVSDLAHAPLSLSMIDDDLRSIARLPVDATTRQRLVEARLGQGRFRADVLREWNGACAVTGTHLLDAVRASHVKPWRWSDNAARLDAANGLALVATLDALFDAGLISFSDDGAMMVSSRVESAEREALLLTDKRLCRPPSAEQAVFLAFHRDKVFRR